MDAVQGGSEEHPQTYFNTVRMHRSQANAVMRQKPWQSWSAMLDKQAKVVRNLWSERVKD